MQRIAGMTVVHAEGVPEAMYNGQRDKVVEAIREEMARQKAAMNAEMDRMEAEHARELAIERDRADINGRNCSQMRGEKLKRLNRSLYRRPGPVKRILRSVGKAYALSAGIVMCLPEIGETLGLWEIIRKEDAHEEYERAAGADRRQRREEPRRRASVC